MDYQVTNKTIEKIKYDLVREGLIDYSDLIKAIEQARTEQASLAQILIQQKIIEEEVLLNFLENKLHIPFVNLDDYSHDPNILSLIKKEEAKKYKILPLFKIEETLTVAMSDPLDLFALNNAIKNSTYKVEPVICSERSIIEKIELIFNQDTYPEKEIIPEEIQPVQFDWQKEFSDTDLAKGNIHKLVKKLIFQAVEENASDIHLDPQENELTIRFRIHGILYKKTSLPSLLTTDIMEKIKSASGINTEEQFLPQTGKIELQKENEIIHARTSTYPNNFGEKLLINIHKKAKDINQYGFEFTQLESFKNSIYKNNGLILGTNTSQIQTIYTILEYLASDNLSTSTIESIIRYNINNINQTQTNSSVNFNYSEALEYVKNQDCDIIYLEKISTKKDLTNLIFLSLSNTLVFSISEAYNAVKLIYNVMEYGISKDIIASCLNMVFDQKELRLLCPKCKQETKIKSEITKKYNLDNNIKFYVPKGCIHCNNTGYKGVTEIFEIIEFDEQTKNAFINTSSETDFTTMLKNKGHKTILDSGLNKVKAGLTSLSEVQKVIRH